MLLSMREPLSGDGSIDDRVATALSLVCHALQRTLRTGHFTAQHIITILGLEW
jgi:hypothetical protein